MAFGNQREQEPLSEINVTPLVDVMLVLLVVFIVTAPLLTQSIGVNLPKTVPAAPPPSEATPLVSLDGKGNLFLDQKPMTPEVLLDTLKQRLAENPALGVQFEIDQSIPYGKAAEVLAIAQHAGISKLSLQTRP